VDEVVSTSYIYPSFIGLLIVAAIVLGVLFLILLVVFAARGSWVSRTTGGAIALALASMTFLTGVWALAFSPADKRYESIVSAAPSIQPTRSWNYQASFREGDLITGNVNLRDFWPKPLIDEFNRTPSDPGFNQTPPDEGNVPRPIIILQTFSLFVQDPRGDLVWSEENTSSSSFTVTAPVTGAYTFKVQNDGPQTLMLFVSISKTVDYRPLEPFGQWLTLVSLPLIGLGIWASLPRRGAQREATRAP